jgi:hypothetical protein
MTEMLEVRAVVTYGFASPLELVKSRGTLMSANTKPLHLSLYIEPRDEVDDDELDCITRRLMAEIQTLDVESVELLRDELTPEGAKSAEAVTLGALLLAMLPVAIPPLLGLVQAWLLRDQNCKVKIKTEVKGQPVELEYSVAMSQGELETLRALLMP